MAIRAIRGATCLAQDDAAEMTEAVTELLSVMTSRNNLSEADFVSVFFTCTPDVHCGFPAAAARKCGFANVPLICAQEIDVPGSLPRVIRIMAHIETAMPRAQVQHVFLRGAQVLRQDLAT